MVSANNRGLSFINKGLHYKLRIAFSLMSILPLLVCVYLFFIYNPYIAKVPFSNLQLIVSMVISVVIAVSGFIVAKGIIDPIVTISSEAKSIAKGQYDKTIDVSSDDEIGDLGNSLNQLTRRIRDSMDELRNYGERTKVINSEINKRVVVLSGLLHISNLITQGAELKEVFDISVGKLAQLKDAAWAILVLKQPDESLKICADFGISNQAKEVLTTDGMNKIFDSVLFNKSGWIINDKDVSKESIEAKQIFNTSNIIFIPVFRYAKVTGFLGVGNAKKDLPYSSDDLELMVVFAKQIAIAIENDYLVNRLKRLEIKDTLTGLYNKSFIVNRLDEEIKRAIIYQRPCAFLLLSIDGFDKFSASFGQLAAEGILKSSAKLLEENCSEADRIARYGDSDFAFVLPEKNKKQTVKFTEEVKHKLQDALLIKEDRMRLTVSAAISENPIDGSKAVDLVHKAEGLLKIAKQEKDAIKT